MLGLFLGTKGQKLSRKEELKLFLIIRSAGNLETVGNEMRLLYNSISAQIWGKLLQKFTSYIPPKLIADLENCFQDGWVLVLEKRTYFDPDKYDNVFNWTLTIMLNFTKNVFNNKPIDLDNANNILEECGIDTTHKLLENNSNVLTPEQIANSNMIIEIIDYLEDKLLTVKQKKAFDLRVKNDKTFKEIAEEMGISIAMVSKHVNRACEVLRIRLNEFKITKNNLLKS